MSASLVGSEMCIRDSAWRARWATLGCRLSGFCLAAHWRGTTAWSALWTCLLYTSDAADDM
eukprot:2096805-Alexandrium_andersonii.AAC.1